MRGILRGVRRENQRRGRFSALGELDQEGEEAADDAEEEEEGEEEEADEKEEEAGNRVRAAQGITEEQKMMVHRLHVNLGHLPLDRMKVMLKAANAKDEVLEFVRDHYKCELCMRQRREISRRKAAFPRSFEFNRIIGIDTFFVKWQGKSMPFLNVVDHGSNWQMVALLRPIEGDSMEPSGGNPTSEETWMHFLRGWIRPHGAPEVVISDGGMEYRGRFERGLEQFGVMQSVTDQESPWQNGRVKDRMEMELSGGSIVLTLEDLECLAMELVACKNAWFNRGGYSPAQLVYGKNPKLPAELLSDAGQGTPGWDEALCDPAEGDSATAEFRRSHHIRERARKLAMGREACKPPLHKHRVWSAGQWVMIWRASRAAVTRSRWVGPGIVILQNGHTVYVAVRSRLWKCNCDQLRPASQAEELGMQVVASRQYQDLLEQMQKQRHGAIDVEREGTPPPEAWQLPVRRDEEAPTLSLPPTQQPQQPEGSDAEGRREREVNERIAGGRGSIRPALEPQPLAPRLGPRGLPQIPREELRRGSHSTVSEPASEPRAAGVPEIEETEGKRRRLLSPLREERSPAAHPEHQRGRTRGHSAPIGPDRLVRTRVRDIERRLEQPRVGRRRSRSPLPLTMQRVVDQEEAENRDRASGEREEDGEDATRDDNLYVDGTSRQRSEYKESCRMYRLEGGETAEHEENHVSLMALTTQSGNWMVQEAARNGEITWSQMTPEEVKKFEESDLQEWKSLEEEFKAVKVWSGREADDLRRRFPDRIMTARVVRRKKPVPGRFININQNRDSVSMDTRIRTAAASGRLLPLLRQKLSPWCVR